jgi:hypothetical protein
LGSLSDVFGLNVTLAPWLRGQQPHNALVCQRGNCVNECVGQVAVVLTEPQKGGVNHVVVIQINEVHTDNLNDSCAQIDIAIGVVSDFLDYLAARKGKAGSPLNWLG